MSAQPAASAGEVAPAPLLLGLPDEIVVWEILVRLPPKSLLRCRAVSPAWRRATSTRRFLLAHHARQPTLHIVCASEQIGARRENILSFDHRAADGHLQPVARFEDTFTPVASCDGLLILFNYTMTESWYSVCNLATRQHAPLQQQLSGFSLLGMYAHRPTGEYRLLLQPRMGNLQDEVPAHQIGCYVFALGSDQLPRYIGAADTALSLFGEFNLGLNDTALLHDCLHWHPLQYPAGSEGLIVFDTTSESFRRMRDPHDVHAGSSIFEMDATFGLYSLHADMEMVDIWVLQDYRGEVWERKYNVKLPAAEIREQFKWLDDNWGASTVSVDGDVLVMVSYGGWLFYIDTEGKLVDNFHRRYQHVEACRHRLKQSLIPHTFFTELDGYVVNASPFV